VLLNITAIVQHSRSAFQPIESGVPRCTPQATRDCASLSGRPLPTGGVLFCSLPCCRPAGGALLLPCSSPQASALHPPFVTGCAPGRQSFDRRGVRTSSRQRQAVPGVEWVSSMLACDVGRGDRWGVLGGAGAGAVRVVCSLSISLVLESWASCGWGRVFGVSFVLTHSPCTPLFFCFFLG